ncbi:Ig-like domain-containing protein [Pediococcus pentosaceus]|uniref:Ig-like domain-containing protein n=1 Tax=Pediococcus pentosaceus TaxID=1255 RepID=A0AB73HEP6_PEDPE|nr:Ig-like domain-containing protein [Pediococcus pentosaceus]MBF7114933.1 Ig-like domain-containing protein [Pediococcus pentosaceus]MDN3207181.1 Ig-like domain-containing protein [Pediococcus pentosaceus]
MTASQKTLSEKVGDSKDITIASDPVNASDAEAVVKATTAKSDNETVATVTKKSDGTFTVTGVKVGTANITFTSGGFTTTLSVTITEAA